MTATQETLSAEDLLGVQRERRRLKQKLDDLTVDLANQQTRIKQAANLLADPSNDRALDLMQTERQKLMEITSQITTAQKEFVAHVHRHPTEQELAARIAAIEAREAAAARAKAKEEYLAPIRKALELAAEIEALCEEAEQIRKTAPHGTFRDPYLSDNFTKLLNKWGTWERVGDQSPLPQMQAALEKV